MITRWLMKKLMPYLKEAIIELNPDSYYLLVLPSDSVTDEDLAELRKSSLQGKIKMVVMTVRDFKLFQFKEG